MEDSRSPGAGRAPPRRPRRRAQLTERDLELLRFMAEHRLVLAAQVQELLGISLAAASRRLGALRSGGYVKREPAPRAHQPACHLLTSKGLGMIASDFGTLSVNEPTFEHDVGLGWLWLAARRRVWGEVRDVVSERRMRSSDAVAETHDQPFGVRVGGFGPSGRERRHYPDLLLVTPAGHRIAVELELTQKSRPRLDRIIGGYALDGRIDAVVYLVEDSATGRRIGQALEAAASRFGISELVHVQRFQRPREATPAGTTRAAARGARGAAADRGARGAAAER